nr:hypothetical protein [Tanacetum cinerariifolium]
MDTRKNIVDLESFKEMLHISPRVLGQSFAELPFEEEILEFLRFLRHSAQIKTLTDVNVNKLFQPWRSLVAVINKCLTGKSFGIDNLRDDILFSTIKVVSRHQNTQQYGAILPIELTTEDIRNIKAYKEYYACATGEAALNPKASARRKRGGSASSTTPPTPIATPTPITTVMAAPRLTATAKGKQPARATSPADPSDVKRIEAEQLKIVLKRSRHETNVSQQGGSSTDKGTGKSDDDDDNQDKGEKVNDDDDDEEEISKIDEQEATESGEGDDEETKSDGEREEEETTEKEEESFDPIPRTPEESEDDGNGEEDQGLRISEEERMHEEEEADELYRHFYDWFIFHRVKSLEFNFSKFMQTNQSPEAVSNIPDGRKQVYSAIRRTTEPLQGPSEAYDANKTILDSYGESTILKRRRKDDDDQEGPSAGSDRGSKKRIEGGEHASASTLSEPATRSAGGSTTGTQSRQMSASESAIAEEPMQTTCQMEEPSHPVFETNAEDQPIVQTSQHPEWFSQPRKPPTPDRDWNKTLPAVQGNAQSWISALAKQTDACSSFNELLDTPIDFSNFIMNRLGVDTFTSELLAGPTYELMRGSCSSLTELEYHLKEVYKVTTDQLDWVNPEGQQYPHNLLQPLPLIPDNRGRRVISFDHFINNDLEYLWGGTSSQNYTTSVTKTKAADYGHIKWIKDLQFYGFVVNWESTLDVYSERRIIAVTDLKIVEWHNYKHLDWISVRRDDDKNYIYKEGDFKRLRLQDIEDMLLLLVQGKLFNLTVEERFAFNVSLRMFTRSIIIQWRVEDLQLGVESYQKRLNLTKPDTYQSDLKRREAYNAYSNPRGFIYQNKDKKNKLMWIDELHKFSDRALNDVRNALDDRLKGIRMQYLPTIIWRKGDKDRAAAMIQAIDKMLKTRRIMRSLEMFVGRRQYEGAFRMLQMTI